MTTKLTLDALIVLDAIDKRGSFAAAASALYRVPSAISYTVQKVESDLNIQLFRKEGRRHILTPAGQHLLASGRDLLLASEQIVASTQAIDRGIEPCLRIAINTVYDSRQLDPAIAALLTQFPNLDVEIIEEALGGAWDALTTDRADLIIGDSEMPQQIQGIERLPMPPIEWVFAVAPHHSIVEEAQPLSEKQIAAYRAVVVKDSSQSAISLTRRVLDQQRTLRVRTMTEKIHAQIAGLAVGYLPLHRVQLEIESGKLITLTLEAPALKTEMAMLWKKQNTGQALRWFIDYLKKRRFLENLYQ